MVLKFARLSLFLVIISLFALVTLAQADVPLITISDVTLLEGAANEVTAFEFTLSRTGDISRVSRVEYQVVGGTATLADNDFINLPAGELIFPIDFAEVTLTIEVVGDAVIEPDEFFAVNLFNPVNGELEANVAQGIIVDDDDPDTAGIVLINPQNLTLAEGDGELVRFTLNRPPTSEVIVQLSPDGQCSANPTTITLNAENWQIGVEVAVVAISDEFTEGEHTCTIQTGTVSSNDFRFNNSILTDITTSILENQNQPAIDAQQASQQQQNVQAQQVATSTPTLIPTIFLPTLTPFPTSTPVPIVGQVTTDVEELAVRTGPYLGATLIGTAVHGFEYTVIARSNDEGGEFTWYFIDVGEYEGWVSGRHFTFRFDENILPGRGSIYDGIDNAPDVGVHGTTLSINDLRRRPSGRSHILATIPANTRLSLIGRTRQNGGDYWYQVRYNGQVGWIPAFVIRGQTHLVPIR